MTIENTPFEDTPNTPNTLTAEEAANVTGYSLPTFMQKMAQLNGTVHDLRAPRVPGKRARDYDGDKVAAWNKAGRPLGAALPQDPNAVTVKGTAKLGPNGWTATIQEPHVTAAGQKMPELRRSLAALAAAELGTETQNVVVELDITPPAAAVPHLARMHAIADQIETLNTESDEQRLATVIRLREAGLTAEEAGLVLRLSHARITQLVREIKALSPVDRERILEASGHHKRAL